MFAFTEVFQAILDDSKKRTGLVRNGLVQLENKVIPLGLTTDLLPKFGKIILL